MGAPHLRQPRPREGPRRGVGLPRSHGRSTSRRLLPACSDDCCRPPPRGPHTPCKLTYLTHATRMRPPRATLHRPAPKRATHQLAAKRASTSAARPTAPRGDRKLHRSRPPAPFPGCNRARGPRTAPGETAAPENRRTPKAQQRAHGSGNGQFFPGPRNPLRSPLPTHALVPSRSGPCIFVTYKLLWV